MELPLPFADFKDYLHTAPDVSPALNQGVSGLFMQLHIPYPDIPGILLLTLATERQDRSDRLPMLLDLDLSRTTDLPSGDDALWSLFEQLHDHENAAFEACITDKMREVLV